MALKLCILSRVSNVTVHNKGVGFFDLVSRLVGRSSDKSKSMSESDVRGKKNNSLGSHMPYESHISRAAPGA